MHTKTKKQNLLAALADHVLKNGLNTASLRPMAAAAGTSDRMLIYHFGNKDALVGELLDYLAVQMAEQLDDILPPTKFESEAVLIAKVMDLMRSEDFQPYIRIWLDIVSAAAQGATTHQKSGRAIIEVYLDWIALRHPEAERAPATLTLIEGMLVMDAVGQKQVSDEVISRLEK